MRIVIDDVLGIQISTINDTAYYLRLYIIFPFSFGLSDTKIIVIVK